MALVLATSPETNEARRAFFKAVLGNTRGWMCLATLPKSAKGQIDYDFFIYPDHLDTALEFVNRKYRKFNVYFCPHVFSNRRRVKANATKAQAIYADLDECQPSWIEPAPSLTVETSPGRWQGYWLLDKKRSAWDIEDVNHRIAYAHQEDGVDSGWALTKLLRVPLTYNLKYKKPSKIAPVVQPPEELEDPKRFSFEELKGAFPEVPGYEVHTSPLPMLRNLKAESILVKYRTMLSPRAIELFNDEPEDDEDWSEVLWSFLCFVFEAGMSEAEALCVADAAACNKYRRDKRPIDDLWQDVQRARAYLVASARPEIKLSELLTANERRRVFEQEPTFIDHYVEWADALGDASPVYHTAGAFFVLSAVLAPSLVLKLKQRTDMKPNLWFLVLGESSITRKSTAMLYALSTLRHVDPESIIASDGSVEGLFRQMAGRANRTSVFYRDEVSGLFNSFRVREYMKAMPEALANLYDGTDQIRVLSKETIAIESPVFVFFGGGIMERVLQECSEDLITSGFLPRFLFTLGYEGDKPMEGLAPADDRADDMFFDLVGELEQIRNTYDLNMSMKLNGERKHGTKEPFHVRPTTECFDRYNLLERAFLEDAKNSDNPATMVPMLIRLANSILKMGMLIAASRREPDDKDRVEMTEDDLLKAISFAEPLRTAVVQIATSIGTTVAEKLLNRVSAYIEQHGSVLRSRIMQRFRLGAKEMDALVDTLYQRGEINRSKVTGRGQMLSASRVR